MLSIYSFIYWTNIYWVQNNVPGIVLNAHKRDKISAKMKFIVHWEICIQNIYKKYNSIIVKILQDVMRKNKRENKLDWFVKKWTTRKSLNSDNSKFQCWPRFSF